ncbi:MAG TPA: hypothetical protein PK513_00180 [Alphaproteobacteria bacterium]|nr:hypothetical protein [Alphaproteobacteria bacterium]USO04838.1 MAG: hypothetical protein H6859_06655 [Rhodospirillales bacterium]HOO80904.1 hypothetical protein [Alphaproteobacteria bacterium]
MSEDTGYEKGTDLVIKGEVGVNAQSNLQELFRENCQLTQLGMIFASDGSYVIEKDCGSAEVPEGVTASELEQANEVLKRVNEELQTPDPHRAF